MQEKPASEFYKEFDLIRARQHASRKTPEAHQTAALEKLNAWFTKRDHLPSAGAIVVLPTGGGKTFSAVRFLCHGPLSREYKVLWLAHTHHLLEQAYDTFAPRETEKAEANGYEVGTIPEPRVSLNVRVVSGTPGHFRAADIKASDDVVIATLQTVSQAFKFEVPGLTAFLRAAGDRLLVVFDEAHHSPAPSYRGLVEGLRRSCPGMYLLGLTATPTHSDESKRGWLKRLFPQGILYQVSAQKLMAAGVLAKPIPEKYATKIVPSFDDREYRKWLGTYGDLPESVISDLAKSRRRNQLIADTYANNAEKYGKAIVFAERWEQCEQLREFLKLRDVRAGAVYSHIDAEEATAYGRNRRDRSENARELEAFRRGDVRVLINVRMLTEGTDVPDAQTVFLTRQTTSRILLTQMVGRALRGPKFGGTDTAYIVSFVDSWKQAINWAEYDQLSDGPADETVTEYSKRPPLQLISIELVRRLSRQMDSGRNRTESPFLTLIPVGWYRTTFDALAAGGDDVETVRDLVLVFEGDKGCYKQFIEHLERMDLADFATESVNVNEVRERLSGWQAQFFPQDEGRNTDELFKNLLDISRHMAQNDNQAPTFFAFAERALHDLDALAEQYVAEGLNRVEENKSLLAEFHKRDRYWSVIYPSYELFKTQYDACVNRILLPKDSGLATSAASVARHPESTRDREPSDEVKRQVKERDGYKCLCCGETNKRRLTIDHIAPSYFGGNNDLSNLQTLCNACNRIKAIEELNFTIHRNLGHTTPLTSLLEHDLPPVDDATNAEAWKQYLRRTVNFFYQCAATSSVTIGKRGRAFYEWQIELCDGNDPEWLRPHLKELVLKIREQIRTARYDDCVMQRLVVTAPGKREVAWPKQSKYDG